MQKPEITPQDLARHLKAIEESSRDERDELLTDLLCHVYATKQAQNT
jgi:hypothetical protein